MGKDERGWCHGAETHGMSQRGGSVIAHLKLGDFVSPMVKSGNADILYAFDKHEAYRLFTFDAHGLAAEIGKHHPYRIFYGNRACSL